MKDIVDDVEAWIEGGQNAIAVATVLKTWGSAPRRPGAKMAIDSQGRLTGSVSGGCVEGAVIEVARESLETGEARKLHFGVVDETAWSVGLACGGSIDVFVENLDLNMFEQVKRLIDEEREGKILTVISGPRQIVGQKIVVDNEGVRIGEMASELEQRMVELASTAMQTQVMDLDEETRVFVEYIRPLPTLIAVGGGEIAIALTRMANLLGYRTVVIDPRKIFASDARFPHVNKLIQKWPRSAFAEVELTPDTAVALLTHDPKIDDPSLGILLDRELFYIGALGSRKTHAKRLERLARKGFTANETSRIHAPIGLDIGAASPAEIAISIMAEIVSVRNGKQVDS
ncbi:MAG: XdhC family protein [Candidatus Promineifilaceae bacterium]|jgi:xanthine dehydrogenase accessory factor